MKNLIYGFALVASLLGTTACSNQWRETSVEANEDDVFKAYDELNTNGGAKGANTALLEDLRADTTSTVYFSQSGIFGSPYSVFSFGDVGFLGSAFGLPNTNGYSVVDLNLKKVTVIFLDAVNAAGQRHFAIMLKMESTATEAAEYFVKTSDQFEFKNGTFAVGFELNDGSTLVLRSNDISKNYSDELAAAIQLKAYVDSGSGERPVGQFSILQGYGGLQ